MQVAREALGFFLVLIWDSVHVDDALKHHSPTCISLPERARHAANVSSFISDAARFPRHFRLVASLRRCPSTIVHRVDISCRVQRVACEAAYHNGVVEAVPTSLLLAAALSSKELTAALYLTKLCHGSVVSWSSYPSNTRRRECPSTRQLIHVGSLAQHPACCWIWGRQPFPFLPRSSPSALETALSHASLSCCHLPTSATPVSLWFCCSPGSDS